jgi:CMP-N-acetylneuraminic acid synthetase
VQQHALQACEHRDAIVYDLFIDIDCTNPLLQVADIQGALLKFKQLGEDGFAPDAVFTVSEARRNPYFNLVETDNDGILRMSKSLGNGIVLARQRAPSVYEHVAGTYVLKTKYLKSASHLLDGRTFGYQIPAERAFDIDSELDFALIEFLLKRQFGL